MITFGVIGGGWRAGFYLRIAKLCPEQFRVAGIYVRNPEKAKLIREKEGVTVWKTLEEIPVSQLDFVVSCVNKNSIIFYLKPISSSKTLKCIGKLVNYIAVIHLYSIRKFSSNIKIFIGIYL